VSAAAEVRSEVSEILDRTTLADVLRQPVGGAADGPMALAEAPG
jgi:hypothetical protein